MIEVDAMERPRGAQRAAPGRDRPASRRGPGLAEPWYLAERCNAECEQGDDAPLALIIVETSSDTAVTPAEWLPRELRRGDVVAHFGGGRYAVLLPGAGGYDAGRVAARIRDRAPHAVVGVAAHPQHGRNLSELVVSALRDIPGPFDAGRRSA